MFLTNYLTAQMLDMKSLVQRLEELGEPQKEFILGNIREFKASEKYKQMVKAQDYYEGKHDILEKKRYYIDRLGVKREDEHLSNNRLIHPYFTKLVNQKVNYLLSKEFSIQVDEDNEQALKFRDLCGKYFNKSFLRKLKNIGMHSIINGIAWVQVYYNEQGKLSFKRIPSTEVIPFWHDAEHTQLDALIRFYTITEYKKNNEKHEITKVEYYTLEGVWYYEIRDGKLVIDNFKVTPEIPAKGHFQMAGKGENGEDVVNEMLWDRLPFIAFKYNEQEISLLNYVKSLVDDYDSRTSDTSDLIADVPSAIKVIRGYGGGDKGEFSQNLATYKYIFVDDPNGGVDQLVSEADTTCTEAHLSRLKEDIYEVGNGVNIQKDILNATSGVALKIRYADLDADCMAMGANFGASLEELCWFIQMDLQGELEPFDLDDIELDIIFNADVVINESDVVANCKNSVGIISDETIIANHPWTTDLDRELVRVKEQREREMQELVEQDGFGTDNNSDGLPPHNTSVTNTWVEK
jgi:SPP1 family phage portal protein